MRNKEKTYGHYLFRGVSETIRCIFLESYKEKDHQSLMSQSVGEVINWNTLLTKKCQIRTCEGDIL